MQNRMAELARRSGLSYRPATLFNGERLTGKFHQRHVVLERIGFGKPDRARWVMYFTRPVEAKFSLRERGLIEMAASIVGVSRQTGDSDFDRRFFVESDPADFGQDLLSAPMLRENLLATARYIRVDLTPSELRFESYASFLGGTKDYAFSMLKLVESIAESAARCAA